MKTLKFRHHSAEEILAGRKTVTWRMFDDKELSVGDTMELLDWESGEKFSEAKITKVREKKLGEIEDEDFEGHERFENKEEMLETYRKYYGERVDWDTMVKMINFKLFEDAE